MRRSEAASETPAVEGTIPDKRETVRSAEIGEIRRELSSGGDDDAKFGMTVTATFGRELFQARQYTSFEIGPHSVTTAVRAGETGEQALERAYAKARSFAEREFAGKLAAHRERLRELAQK